MRLKPFLVNIGLSLLSVFALVLVLEIVLQFLPVAEGFNFLPVNSDDTIFRARPTQVVTHSDFWNLWGAKRIKVNNAGFRNDQDYVQDPQLPLIAVVGDSYVHAVQVDYEETFYGRLAKDLGGEALVYSFGFGGAPLSQYLIWARHAHETYGNDWLTFLIISNDFDQSLVKHKKGPGFHHYGECNEAEYCLQRFDFQIHPLVPLVKKSALARYLVYNLRVVSVSNLLRAFGNTLFRRAEYVANVEAVVGPEHMEDSRVAVDLFLRDLPGYSNLPPDRVSFLVDGRNYGSAEEFHTSFFGRIRQYFMDEARARGYSVIDLYPAFAEDFKRNARPFEFERDSHWNSRGHAVAAAELSKYYQRVLDSGH